MSCIHTTLPLIADVTIARLAKPNIFKRLGFGGAIFFYVRFSRFMPATVPSTQPTPAAVKRLGETGEIPLVLPGVENPAPESRIFIVTKLVTLCYTVFMRIISRRLLREFWVRHPDSAVPLQTWYRDVSDAGWKTPQDIKDTYHNASFLANNRIVFNIKGNHYRLVVVVMYQYGVVYIRFVGTHEEYDRIDATAV